MGTRLCTRQALPNRIPQKPCRSHPHMGAQQARASELSPVPGLGLRQALRTLARICPDLAASSLSPPCRLLCRGKKKKAREYSKRQGASWSGGLGWCQSGTTHVAPTRVGVAVSPGSEGSRGGLSSQQWADSSVAVMRRGGAACPGGSFLPVSSCVEGWCPVGSLLHSRSSCFLTADLTPSPGVSGPPAPVIRLFSPTDTSHSQRWTGPELAPGVPEAGCCHWPCPHGASVLCSGAWSPKFHISELSFVFCLSNFRVLCFSFICEAGRLREAALPITGSLPNACSGLGPGQA